MSDFDTVLVEAAIGVTVLVAAGDDGATDIDDGHVNADFPASSPIVTACGGTTLVGGDDGSRLRERVERP